jgi:hypothetical protein
MTAGAQGQLRRAGMAVARNRAQLTEQNPVHGVMLT